MNFDTPFQPTTLFGETTHQHPMDNCYDNQRFISRDASYYIPSPYHLCLSSDDEEEGNKHGFSGSLVHDGTNCSTSTLSAQQQPALVHQRSESYDASLSLSPLSPLSPPGPWCNGVSPSLVVNTPQDGSVIDSSGLSLLPEPTDFTHGHCANTNELLIHPFLPHSIDPIEMSCHTSPSMLNYNTTLSPTESTAVTPDWLTKTRTLLDQWEDQVVSEMDERTFQLAGKRDGTEKPELPNLSLENVDPDEASLHLKKYTHNAIERRYRNNINHRITELKNVVPALSEANDETARDEDAVIDGIEVADKMNKATILRKATEYIGFLKRSNAAADRENSVLQELLGQIPGGALVLSEFKQKQRALRLAVEKRQAFLRQVAKEKDRIDHQRLLRERAAQRAELAKLLPKSANGRRPYQKRSPRRARPTSKQQS